MSFSRCVRNWVLKSLFIVVFFAKGSAAVAATVPLGEAFEHAVQKTEAVAIAERQSMQTEETVNQVRGSIFPSLSFLGSYTRQHVPTAENSNGVGAFRLPDQYSTRFNLTQPLFRGLREFRELSAAKHTAEARKLSANQVRLDLYARVADAYYNVLSAEKDLENLRVLLELTDKRVKELRSRTSIGRSRKGELLSAMAQVATLRAQSETTIAQVSQARDNFVFVTGLPRQSQLVDETNDKIYAKPLNYYIQELQFRPDVRSREQDSAAASDRIASAWGGHLPTLDFSANYYLKRTGVLENSKWDLGLQLAIPIFQGGVVQSQIREATWRHKEAELSLSQTRRAAELSVRTLHENLTRTLSQERALRDALTIAEQNYAEQNRDYRFGLVTNLDVLQALNTFQETKRLLDRSRYQAKIAFAALNAAIGQIQ